MTHHDPRPTTDPDDLESVPVRPREQRGAVVSVRLSARDAAMLAELASRSGVSVSEFSRRVLRQAISNHWQLQVWRRQTTLVFPSLTGGDFSSRWFVTDQPEDTAWWVEGCERSVGTP